MIRNIIITIINSINKYNINRQNISIDQTYVFNGILFFRNYGTIKIGSRFKATSGKNYNPIGGDTILRLVCRKNAKIIIGDNAGISNSTFRVCNSLTIDNNVMIGGGCKVWDSDFHSIDYKDRIYNGDQNVLTKPILICENAFIGANSIILKGVKIGKNSIVGAGSIVTKSIPDNEIWAGNPAKK